MDFTHYSELGVTIGGEPFRHLLFHLMLSHSGWSYAEVCFGETFAALVKGLQGALGRLLESGLSFDYAMVRKLSAPAPPPVPDLKLSGTVDLGVYDRLLVGGAR